MNNPFTKPLLKEERQRRTALMISLITGVIFAIVSVTAGPAAYRENSDSGQWIVGIAVFLALSAFIGAFLVSRERITLGIGIIVTTILLMALILPFVSPVPDLALAILTFIVVAGISSTVLARIWATRAIVSAFIVAAIITFKDLYFPDFDLTPIAGSVNLFAVISLILYAFFTLRNFNTYALRSKVLIAFVLIAIVPLGALGVLNNRNSAQALEAQSQIQVSTIARQVTDNIDGFMTEQLHTIHAEAKQSSLTKYMSLPADARSASEEETNARFALTSLTRRNPVFIRSIGILDAGGRDILDTFEGQRGQSESNFEHFISPLQTKLPYVSNIVFHDSKASLFFSAPIIDSTTGAVLGVLRVEYYATILQSMILNIDPGNPGTTISLVDSDTYLQIATTGARDELFTSIKNFDDLDLAALQAENRLPPGARNDILKGADETIVTGLNNLVRLPYFDGYSKYLDSDTLNTGAYLDTQPWIAVVSQSTLVYLAPVNNQNKTTVLISLILIALSGAAGFSASTALATPLTTLAKVADKVTAGDRTARAKATIDDEIGALATSFNRMTEELNQALNNLETRVAERTADLEISTHELQAIGEISKVITSEQKPENLLLLITHLVSELFGFYHTGIFLIDETGQYSILQAANSEGGKNMMDRGYKLDVGGAEPVAYVAQTGNPRIALDVGRDAVYFNNLDLPKTRSEMALPLKVRDKVMGVLDVQSEKPSAFTENDTKTLTILADQIAIALENARLFAQTEQALNEAQSLYRQSSREGWLSFGRERAFIGYQQNLKGGRKLSTPVETDQIRQALNGGNALVFNKNNGDTHEPSIVVPIKFRGQMIGTLNIKAPTQDRRWTNDEINLVEAIAERLGLALDNARLFEETSTRASRESLVSDITTKIRGTNDPQEMIKTTVEELKRILGATHVEVVSKTNGLPPDK